MKNLKNYKVPCIDGIMYKNSAFQLEIDYEYDEYPDYSHVIKGTYLDNKGKYNHVPNDYRFGYDKCSFDLEECYDDDYGLEYARRILQGEIVPYTIFINLFPLVKIKGQLYRIDGQEETDVIGGCEIDKHKDIETQIMDVVETEFAHIIDVFLNKE